MEFTINVHVTGLDKLSEAIEKLAGRREENAVVPIATAEKADVPVSPAPVSAPPSTPALVATAPVPTATPTSAMETTPAPVAPAAAPTYTVDELARAAAPLMDNAAGMQTLCNLLAQFGVQSLQQLPQDKYGAFATELRGLGANI